MRTTYKKPKTVQELVEYLEQNKKVTYNDISKKDAEKILYEHCYINVITPYKHCFARFDPSTGKSARDAKNNHIYDHETEFSKYYQKYQKERVSYQKIFENLMWFESTFNSIVATEVLNYYHIDSFSSFLSFCNTLSANVISMNIPDKVREHLLDEISGFYQKMKRYEDSFIFFDRLSLSNVIVVYRACDKKVHDCIFQGLLQANATFGYSSPGTFDDFLKRVVPIRNCVCHANSLEVLVEYYNIKTKELRNATDKTKYKNIITKLSV